MTVTINGNPPSALQQQELAQAFGLASSNSPALTGAPTAPTAPAGTNTTQIASTAFVKGEVDAAAATSATNTANALVGERSAVATLTNKTLTNPVIGSGVANGVAYLNGSKVLTAGSGLTFDGVRLTAQTAASDPIAITSASADSYISIKGSVSTTLVWAGVGATTGAAWVGSLSNTPFAFYQNNTEQMRLTSTGLGIGTSSPTYKLDVRGAGDQTIRVVSNTGGTASLDLTSYGVYAWKLHSNTALSFAKDSSELLRLDASGNLLLGATAAAYATSGRTCFEVTGTSSAMVTLRAGTGSSSGYLFGGADALSLEAEPGRKIVINTIGVEPISIRTNQIERVHIDSNGNLGLGVVPSVWFAPHYAAMQLGDTGSYLLSGKSTLSGDQYFYMGNNGNMNAVGNWTYTRSRPAASYLQFNGEHRWNSGPAGVAGDPLAFTQTMTLDQSGKLNLGMTGGLRTFNVRNNVSAYSSMSIVSNVYNGDAGGSTIYFGNLDSDARGYIDFDNQNAYMAFGVNSSERLRIDSAGTLNIGWAGATGGKLIVGGVTRSAQQGTRNALAFSVDNTASAPAWAQQNLIGHYFTGAQDAVSIRVPSSSASNTGSYDIFGDGSHRWYGAAAGTNSGSSGAALMTLDASGNLLIGQTSGTGKLCITQSGAAQDIVVCSLGSGGAASSVFGTAATVTSLYIQTSSGYAGSIMSSGLTTTYATSSDYRLKNITGPVTNSGAYIDSLNPVEGSWKADGSTFVGLIAHEVQEASRTQVATGVKDGEEMQAMDYSSSELIANMIAELKSLRARVAALENI